MALFTALGTMAALTNLAVGGQDPSFDFQVVAPVIEQASAAPGPTAEVSTNVAQRNVTVQFRNARAGEVFDWLQKQGVNFVAVDDEVRNNRITVNVTDRPLDEVVDAIGSALGGTWRKQGNTRVFYRQNVFFSAPTTVQGQLAPLESRSGTSVFGDAKLYRELMKDGQNFDAEKFAKEFNKSFDAEKFAKEFQKHFDAEKFAKDFQKSFDAEKFAKEFNETFMRDFMKEFKKQYGEGKSFMWAPDAKGYRLDPKDQEEMRKNIQEMRERIQRDMKTNPPRVPAMPKNFRSFTFGDTKLVPMTPMAPLAINSTNFKELMRSLSPEQRDLQKKQGYLKVTDLTAAQRRMLGNNTSGDFTITYRDGSEEITIKSK